MSNTASTPSLEDLKNLTKKAIKKVVAEIEDDASYYRSDGNRELSQTALNLSATLAQLNNIDIAEEHLRLDREADASEPRPRTDGVVH